ncbi:hypothetical protein HC928_11455 [bacterium]|nr:hypothetical protein [bacterium]
MIAPIAYPDVRSLIQKGFQHGKQAIAPPNLPRQAIAGRTETIKGDRFCVLKGDRSSKPAASGDRG